MRLKTKKVSSLEEIPNPTNLRKVISGMQIGVDIAAIRAAKKMGFKTGGNMPHGYITLDGPRPGYSWQYGANDRYANYKERTWENVKDGDATIRLATDFGSRGEICTLNAIRHYRKPSIDIYLEKDWLLPESYLAAWISRGGYRVLNIAGNANKELEQQVEDYLIRVFNVLLWE